ncbi:SDR family oxidoreductase [Lysinibacillus sphaericus]|uniref:SDR family oxidoreductase n=1 Tax=Lysinibacillus sphaericus TaxID=1421 RepID=UPI00216160C9|nr:SDR family oxidoreductase [Lysinibacillus sphaericus]MCS1383871.1 SDR family oxidoreductase [Lysinibacillus sphaericus]
MGVHFFTGFPGFISSQLIRELFQENKTQKVIAIVLAGQYPKAMIEKSKIEVDYPQCEIQIVEGDITLPNLGLANQLIQEIVPQIEVFWHLAAVYDLAVPRDIAWKVNVHGTAMVNDFVRTLPHLKRYMYFSTAYVAGTREGVLRENELIRPKAFKNYYEETKYEAEHRVEDLKSEVPITIIRPGIVRGHSVTGETIKFDGPYFFLNMVDKLKWLPIIPYIGMSSSAINVVPVDYIINASTFLVDEKSAEGKTLHLTDPNPHPVQEVYRTMVKLLTNHYPKGRFPLALAKKSLQVPFIRKKLGVEQETLDYLTWHATFDTTEAIAILQKGNIACPDFIQTMPKMVDFYLAHKEDENYHIQIK